ncbi:MAG: hypothetical protein PVG14_16750 [Anaerolineales bacterium]|jgi:hypothetical protein
MKKKNIPKEPEECIGRSPQSALEKELIEKYLRDKGYRMVDLRILPKTQAKKIMKEACLYASLKLAEIESKAGFRHKIKYDT